MQFTLTELLHHMGLFARVIVGVMAVMSIASLYVTAERLFTLRKAKRQSVRLRSARWELCFSQGGIEAAAAVEASPNVGYLGRVIEAGLAAYRTTRQVADPELIFESVSRALERQAQREAQGMKSGQGVLGTVGSTAPFVGLLGTVMGIVNSFQSMGDRFRRSRYGVGRNRRSAHHDRFRASRRHPGRHVLQLLPGLDRGPQRGHRRGLQRASRRSRQAAGSTTGAPLHDGGSPGPGALRRFLPWR